MKHYDDDEKFLINETSKGSSLKYKDDLERGMRDLINWKDIENSYKILPTLENAALELMERRLGYPPSESSHLPFQPYIRGLIDQHRKGAISDEQFSFEAEEHIKLIRNAEIKRYAADKKLVYNERDYLNYERSNPIFKDKVRERIGTLLGYYPDLKYSLEAEIKMRKFFRDEWHWKEGWYIFDFFTVMIIKYREYLIDEGREAANSSPLLGFLPAVLK